MADVCVVVRYREALTYGVHALMAALEAPGTKCEVRILVLWSFYSPDAADQRVSPGLAAELAGLGARIHAHAFRCAARHASGPLRP